MNGKNKRTRRFPSALPWVTPSIALRCCAASVSCWQRSSICCCIVSLSKEDKSSGKKGRCHRGKVRNGVVGNELTPSCAAWLSKKKKENSNKRGREERFDVLRTHFRQTGFAYCQDEELCSSFETNHASDTLCCFSNTLFFGSSFMLLSTLLVVLHAQLVCWL